MPSAYRLVGFEETEILTCSAQAAGGAGAAPSK
jgi:hypothetical protein